MSDYFATKRGADDWIVSGRRHHLQIVRTEGQSGREDRRGRDILQTIYIVEDRANVIDVSDQFEIEPHGFTRLKDAIRYATGKLKEYDERVDPKKRRSHNTSGLKKEDVDTARVLQVLGDELPKAVERHEAGFHFEEGGCWAFAIALKRFLKEFEIDSTIQVMHGFRHALVKVGDVLLDHQGVTPAGRIDTIESSDVDVSASAVRACGLDQFESDLAWALEIVHDAAEQGGLEAPKIISSDVIRTMYHITPWKNLFFGWP